MKKCGYYPNYFISFDPIIKCIFWYAWANGLLANFYLDILTYLLFFNEFENSSLMSYYVIFGQLIVPNIYIKIYGCSTKILQIVSICELFKYTKVKLSLYLSTLLIHNIFYSFTKQLKMGHIRSQNLLNPFSIRYSLFFIPLHCLN